MSRGSRAEWSVKVTYTDGGYDGEYERLFRRIGDAGNSSGLPAHITVGKLGGEGVHIGGVGVHIGVRVRGCRRNDGSTQGQNKGWTRAQGGGVL